MDLAVIVGMRSGLTAGLTYLLPVRQFVLVIAVSAMSLVFYPSSVAVASYDAAFPAWTATAPLWSTLIAPFTVAGVLFH